MSTREITFAQAIREALDEELARDEKIVLFGEDIGAWGGVFRTTEGLYEKYGPERVIDTPLSEEGYVGLAVGIAMTGMHPVPEIMFGDFITLAMDQIVNQAAKMRYMTGGQVAVPITIRATMGGGRSSGAQHSQSWHAWFAHVPGLKVVVPSTPYDAKGLLKTALREPNPVLFFEDKVMYHKIKNQGTGSRRGIPDPIWRCRHQTRRVRCHHCRSFPDGAYRPGGCRTTGTGGNFCRGDRSSHPYPTR